MGNIGGIDLANITDEEIYSRENVIREIIKSGNPDEIRGKISELNSQLNSNTLTEEQRYLLGIELKTLEAAITPPDDDPDGSLVEEAPEEIISKFIPYNPDNDQDIDLTLDTPDNEEVTKKTTSTPVQHNHFKGL